MIEETLEERIGLALVNVNAQKSCEECGRSYHKETVKTIYGLAEEVIEYIARITPKEFWESESAKEYSKDSIKENMNRFKEFEKRLEKTLKDLKGLSSAEEAEEFEINRQKTEIYCSALKFYQRVLPGLLKYEDAAKKEQIGVLVRALSSPAVKAYLQQKSQLTQ